MDKTISAETTSAVGRWLNLALRVLVLFAAFVFLARGVRWLDVTTAARRAGFLLPALIVAVNACMMAVKALRLRVLLRNPKVSFGSCFWALLTCSAINNVTPFRGGDVARLWMLERAGGVTKSAAMAIAVVEGLIELSVLATIGFFASLAISGQRWATVTAPVVVFAAIAVLIVLRVTTGRAADAAAPNTGSPRGLSMRTREFLRRLEPGSRALSEPGAATRAIALSVVAWLCECVMVVLCAHAVGLPIGFALAPIVLLGINLAMALPSTPASAGPFESAAAGVLILAGVAKGPAVAFALLYHAIQVIPVTLVGVTVLLLLRRGQPVAKHEASKTPNPRRISAIPTAEAIDPQA
jgi:uncharacterized protein (TIRG00374 family)